MKPKICNVVCTANLEQKVNLNEFIDMPCGIYDEAIYGGRCGYIKTPEMNGRVTVFPSGKMISVGGRTIRKAVEQLNHTKFYLMQEKAIKSVNITPIVRNIVATITTGQQIPIEKLAPKISGAIYDPETFPGMILKGFDSCTFLIFASGKIVVTGAKSSDGLNHASFEIIQRLNGFTV